MSTVNSQEMTRYWAVVPAAGLGRRMNVDIPKQYLEVRGQTLMEHTIQRLLDFPLLEKIVVVVDKEDDYFNNIALLKDTRILFATGGSERYESVINGLDRVSAFAADDDWVMVHDVARPCIRRSDLDWLVEQLKDHPVGGLLGIPVSDTIKRTGVDGLVTETVDRNSLWHALTPQMYRLGVLYKAMTRAIQDKVPVTDEAAAIEYAGLSSVMVEGHSDNIKVTRGTDLALASLYIEQQSKLIEAS